MAFDFELVSSFALGTLVGGYFIVILRRVDKTINRMGKPKTCSHREVKCLDCQKPLAVMRPYRVDR